MPFTVRNLSAADFSITCIERFQGPDEDTTPNPLAVLTNFIGLSTAAAAEVADGAQASEHEDVSLALHPFSTVTVDKSVPEKNDVVRLIFDVSGQQYRVDIAAITRHSNKLVPLNGEAQHDLSAIYVPADGFLAIFHSPKLSDWMANVPDQLPLSVLSIPGTHNSPTCYAALPSVRCQAVSPREQLDNGVRFFDLRAQIESAEDPSKTGLILVHGVFPISLTGSKYLADLVTDLESFLSAHPRETVIVSLKREGSGEGTDQQFAKILREHYVGDSNKWFIEPRIPRIGEARGKVVVLRRFGLDDEGQKGFDGRGWGINAQNWQYNCENDESGDVIVQDFCEVLETENIDKKIQVCCSHLDRSGAIAHNLSDVPKLYLNFLSASNFWRVGCWPDRIAAKLNPAVLSHLCVKHVIENHGADWCTGVVVCDYVGNKGDWDLVKSIVAMNEKLLQRSK
jgi:1-phosphatidylinositol phosphodiesterase